MHAVLLSCECVCVCASQNSVILKSIWQTFTEDCVSLNERRDWLRAHVLVNGGHFEHRMKTDCDISFIDLECLKNIGQISILCNEK